MSEVMQMTRGRPHKCPYCEATRNVAKGFRYNRSGKVRLRRCKQCGRRWTVGPAQIENGAHAEQPARPTEPQHEAGPRPDGVDISGESENSQKNRSIELSLGAGESPSHENPGEERKEESEDTLFKQ